MLVKPLDPRIGTLEIFSEEWGYNEDGEISFNTTPLETHKCTDQELGLSVDSSEKSRFMPISKAF